MKLRKLLVVLFVLVCVVSLACFTACKDGGDVNDDSAGDQITDGGNDNVGDNNANDNVQPEQPEDPEEPEVPTDPEEPEVPTDPEEPEVPTDPEEPEVPTDPEDPEVPTDPEEPEVPTDPEEPEVPTDPEDPEVPTDPEEPEVPTDPEEPEVPTDPEEPEVPTDPEEPEVPTDPEDPEVDPEQPEQPEVLEEGIYYYNANGWENVYVYAWTETATPDAPTVGDYVIMGVNGDWTTEGSIKLIKDGDQYKFEGLRLTKGTAFKIVCLGATTHAYYGAVESYVDTNLYSFDVDGNIVIANDGIYNFYFKDGSKELYFGTGSNESTPNMKVESTVITEAWPGTQMTAVEGHDGWFYIGTIEADYVIFNNGLAGEEAAQTANIAMDSENTFYNGTEWVNGIN